MSPGRFASSNATLAVELLLLSTFSRSAKCSFNKRRILVTEWLFVDLILIFNKYWPTIFV